MSGVFFMSGFWQEIRYDCPENWRPANKDTDLNTNKHLGERPLNACRKSVTNN